MQNFNSRFLIHSYVIFHINRQLRYEIFIFCIRLFLSRLYGTKQKFFPNIFCIQNLKFYFLGFLVTKKFYSPFSEMFLKIELKRNFTFFGHFCEIMFQFNLSNVSIFYTFTGIMCLIVILVVLHLSFHLPPSADLFCS